MESPNVFFETPSLAAYLNEFLPAEDATKLAETIAGIPVGTVTPQEADPADLLLAERNEGNISHYGAELGLEYFANENWTLGGTYTYRNRNFFKKGANPLARDKALNAPKYQFGARVEYEDPAWGLRTQLRFRYLDGYPVRSFFGDFVDTYSVLDLNARYQLPFDRNLSLTLSVQNSLNNKHKEHAAGPEIGRLSILKLNYSL